MSTTLRAREALQQYFGFADFREGQEQVIESILEGRDSVVVMPTGGGKSLCYQLPALMMNGITLVVSPLIALMKDQVDALAARGIPTTFINSSLSYGEANKRLSEMRRGLYKLVYVAPERFRNPAFEASLAELKVTLFVVDEAHCISHWGHDFRPDYLRLKQAAERLRRPQIAALTATATPQVRADIGRQLGLNDPRVFVAGFARPNLALRVRHTAGDTEKGDWLKEIIGSEGAGIVYAATRKSVEQVTAMLKMSGINATAYHGGMEELERTRTQEAFMTGRARAIVATNAFGMGIDKPDIRFVVHYHIPGSIEAYYQEVGRAGRDGEKSDCVLLFNYADTRTQQFFIEGNHPSPGVIDDVYRELWSAGTETVHLSAREISKRLELKNDMSVSSALTVLEKAGHIERGRTSDSVIVALMRLPMDKALDAVRDESREGRVLRELIFDQDVNEREQTELDLRRLSARLQISEGLTRRSLATLSSLGLITYRNLFSGRGIRLLDEKPVRQLRIDARELASRAAAEQAKLRRMLDYCYWEKGCLQRFILNYFGDPKEVSSCGICSNCRTEADLSVRTATKQAGTLAVARAARSAEVSQATPLDRFIIDQAPSGGDLREELRRRAESSRVMANDQDERNSAARKLEEDEVVVVRKVLSCVARLKGRFGKGTVTAVLRGSRAKQVTENHLDELSTYGLLRDMSQDEVAAYIRALMEAGCIVSQRSVYPTVALSEFGREVMVGRTEVMLELPSQVSR